MKQIVSRLKNIEFNEHLDPMQLTLFKEHKLSDEEREEVFKHLAQCKRCREVLKFASELEEEESAIKPVNNPDYKRMIKHFLPFAAAIIIFLGVPMGDKYLHNNSLKSAVIEKNIFVKSIEYWEDLFSKLFKKK